MNTVANVSAAKPKVNGAVFNAPLGTTLPTTATETLNAAFAALGYVSDAGVANANSPKTTNVKAWGGDVVLITEDEKPDTFKLTLIEGLNVEVLKTVYGDDKVSGTLETGISIAADAGELEEKSWVVDMLLRGNVAKRIVIPRGKLSNLEEIAYRDNEVIGYGITIACLPDSSGKSHYEYIKAPATGTLTLDKATASVAVGSTVSITPTTSPAGGTVKWSTADSDIATVTGGTVTGIAAGTVVITARVQETGAVASCSVTVTGT